MTIHALIFGQLVREPQVRIGRNGRPFTLVRTTAAGEHGEVSVSVIAFGQVGEQLAALCAGDRVAMTGAARPSIWRGRDGEWRSGLELTRARNGQPAQPFNN